MGKKVQQPVLGSAGRDGIASAQQAEALTQIAFDLWIYFSLLWGPEDACGTGRGLNKYVLGFLSSTSMSVAKKVLLQARFTNTQISKIYPARDLYTVFSIHQKIKQITYKIAL